MHSNPVQELQSRPTGNTQGLTAPLVLLLQVLDKVKYTPEGLLMVPLGTLRTKSFEMNLSCETEYESHRDLLKSIDPFPEGKFAVVF